MAVRFRILALLIAVLPMLFTPLGVRIAVCFCWQVESGGARAAVAGELAPDVPIEWPVAAQAHDDVRGDGHRGDAEHDGRCACCKDMCEESHGESPVDGPRVTSPTCPGCHVLACDHETMDRAKCESSELDFSVFVGVRLIDEPLAVAPRGRRIEAATGRARVPCRSLGGMPLRV